MNYIVDQSGHVNLAGATSVNGLLIVGTSTPTVINQQNNNLVLAAGTLVFAGSQTATISGGAIPLGTIEGAIQTAQGASAAVGSNITNTTGVGLSIGGSGTLTLSGANTYTNTSATQTLSITGTPTGGTFTVTFGGQTSIAMGFDATAATIQSTLQALPNIGLGNVQVTGANPGPFTITFSSALAASNVGATGFALGANALTGGAGPTVTFTPPTAGVFATTLAGGTLNLASTGALSTGGVQFISGSLAATAIPLTLANSLVFNNSSATFTGTNSITVTGSVALDGVNDLINVGGNVTFAGALINGTTAGSLSKFGGGTLTLTNPGSTYTGQTNVVAGFVNVQNSAALGARQRRVAAAAACNCRTP